MPKLTLIALLIGFLTAYAQMPISVSALESLSNAQKAYKAHDYLSAAQNFKQAADQGNIEAQYMYGLMLYRGEGTIADAEQAVHYYRQAAMNDFAKAQYNLAVLCYQGAGVARDDVQAYKWLYLASQNKEPRALSMLPVADRNLSADQKAQALADIAKDKEPSKL